MESHHQTSDIATPNRPPRRWLKRIVRLLLALLIFAFCAQMWRHYRISKRLAETLAEMDRTEPGWRPEEIEAAREQIPEQENSARVVVAAGELLPDKYHWPSPEFIDTFKQLPPEEQLSAEDYARLKAELDKAGPALEIARKVADMPRGRHRIIYQRNPLNTSLPDQSQGRSVYRLLFLDILRWDQEGNAKNALISCRAALNTARAVGDEPILVSQLLRAEGSKLVCQAVEHALAQGEAPPEELAAMQHLLAAEDAFPDLLISMRGERAMLHEMFDAIETSDVPLSQLDPKSADWQNYAFGWFTRDKFREAHPIMMAQMRRFLAITQLPMHQQAAALRELEPELRGLKESHPIAVLFLPALQKVAESSRRKHASLRCIIVALAAERYRQRHKALPDSIDKLCPQFLPAVPVDPFDGQPLRYRRLGDGVRIYTVDQDGIDDGGRLDLAHATEPGVDMGYRLWDAAKRRQPATPKPPQGAKPE